MTKSRARPAAPPLAVAISQELFLTKTVGELTLLDAMREAARARGFVALEATSASGDGTTAARLLPLTRDGVPGARVRADLGPHAQPIATAAARAMGSPVTLLSVSGTATGSRGRLEISLSVLAMDIDRSGKARPRRGLSSPEDYTQVDELDWGNARELIGAARDRAGMVFSEAAQALDLSLEHDGERIVHTVRRPTGSDRVEEILSLLADADGYELSSEPDGRVVVKVTLEAGKRMAFLSPEEASELKKRLAR